MKKLLAIFLLSAAFLALGLIITDYSTGGTSTNPSVYWVCGCDNGVKKGPDENGKVSIKCFDPKGEWKYNDGVWQCKGTLWHSPGLYGSDSCSPTN